MSEREMKIGQVYVFPLHAMLLPPEAHTTDRYGACKVVDIARDGAVLATLDWVGRDVPDVSALEHCPMLHNDRGPFEGTAAIFWGAGEPPDDVRLIDVVPLSEEETEALSCTCEGAMCCCPRHYGGWRTCRANLYRVWRHRAGQEDRAASLRFKELLVVDRGPRPKRPPVDRVYLLRPNVGVTAGLYPVEPSPGWYEAFSGSPLPPSMPFLQVRRRNGTLGGKPLCDFPGLIDHIPVFSRGAAEALSDLLMPNGELVPVACTDCDREVVAFNVTRLVRALDPTASRIASGGGRQARDVRRHVFRAQRLTTSPIFKVPETALRRVYVTGAFVDRVLTEELKGFVFKLIWAKDGPLAFCPYCLAELYGDTAYCHSCGLEITGEAPVEMTLKEHDALPTKVCPFCGSEIPEPADPCPYCGCGIHRHGVETAVAII